MALTLTRAAWAHITPFALFIALLALRGALPPGSAWGLDTRWLYAGQAVAVAALLGLQWRHFGELSRQNLPSVRQWLIGLGVGIVVFGLWITLTAPWMQAGRPAAGFVPLTESGELDLPLIAFRLLGAALVVPVMEELFWRGFLMRWIDSPVFEVVDPQQVSAKAVLLSTFVFTLAHTQWLAAALAGLAYAALYRVTGKLWTAVVAHAVTNALLGAWVLATRQWQFW